MNQTNLPDPKGNGQEDSEKLWKEEKEEWKQKLKKLDFPPDLEQNVLLGIQQKLDNYFTEAAYELSKYKTMYENMEDKIEAVKKRNYEGNNPEERKKNAFNMLIYFPHGEPNKSGSPGKETTNLIAIRNNIRKRYYFYKNFVMKTIEKKDRRMDSITGISKVEVSLAGKPGA